MCAAWATSLAGEVARVLPESTALRIAARHSRSSLLPDNRCDMLHMASNQPDACSGTGQAGRRVRKGHSMRQSMADTSRRNVRPNTATNT
ncbi:hypothetical protein NITHO_4030001 [Nitrolancea hollandica Lb]|uniref:Uncharacterized protein n=1 Tax=Nitrolancea hollandica Lb TaxID=1129897 RepID=I4EJH0_9BACT|nr:hypothetical protein NITHO_4030001 [Nitrolancea hollandica Lb]